MKITKYMCKFEMVGFTAWLDKTGKTFASRTAAEKHARRVYLCDGERLGEPDRGGVVVTVVPVFATWHEII